LSGLPRTEAGIYSAESPPGRSPRWKRMTMKPNEIKTIFDYNFWAFERVWGCISQISDEQFIEEFDYSTGSIRIVLIL
jgi:hypothetical protein